MCICIYTCNDIHTYHISTSIDTDIDTLGLRILAVQLCVHGSHGSAEDGTEGQHHAVVVHGHLAT